MVDNPSIKPHFVILGEKLKAQLRLELRALLREWNFAGNPRRREIARELT
jgi:hypothetical protein